MKITVITPYYNGDKYMDAYVDCILSQDETLKRAGHCLNVIMVNDSPEKRLEVGKGDDNDFIRVITNEKNSGIHFSRVKGLGEIASDTDYVMFLDQDDTLEHDALATMLEHALVNSMPSVVVANAKLQQSDGSHLLWYRNAYHKSLVGDLTTYIRIGTQIISPGQCIIRPAAIPEFWKTHIMSCNGADDYFLWLLMLAKGEKFSYCDEPLYEHHYTAVNLSADTTVTDESSYEFMEYLGECEYFSQEDLFTLHEMVTYKNQFRASDKWGKALCSLANLSLFVDNIKFKKKTGTKLGFNR
ncbi:MAG: glycosyltransferase [Pseudobutyrivibrio sp.]|nr:glycosyltransferase [Pseudobutyrivibrio sp.]